jgi:hypothetical protein
MSEETRLIKQTAMVREANEFSDQVLQCKKKLSHGRLLN